MTAGLRAEVLATVSLEKELKINSVPLLVINVIKYTDNKTFPCCYLLRKKEEVRAQTSRT